jgi:hypothetical protein
VTATITAAGWSRIDDARLAGMVDEILVDQRARNGGDGR